MGKTTIEINGKQYDASTGALLGESSAPAKKAAASPLRHSSRVVDGFVRPSKANASVQQSSQARVQNVAKPVIAKNAKRGIAEIKPAKGHKPQHAQTLMRKTVKKPDVTLKPAIKAQIASEIAAAPKSSVAVPQFKKSAQNVDEQRLARAQSVGQSQHIKRFVAAAPTAEAVSASQVPTAQKSKPTRATYQTTRTQYDVAARPQLRATTGKQQATRGNDIFEAAVANARSHEQPEYKPAQKASSKLLRISAGFASVLVLIGFIAYVNMSAIQLHVASMQAGFHAQLPSFKPTGYALTGGVRNSNGIVSFRFQSGDSSFNIQQQSSNWDSQTLLDNVVATASTSHKTYQNNGRTVYIYGDNATWVNGGVLYNMKVTGDLSNQQVVNVAASM